MRNTWIKAKIQVKSVFSKAGKQKWRDRACGVAKRQAMDISDRMIPQDESKRSGRQVTRWMDDISSAGRIYITG